MTRLVVRNYSSSLLFANNANVSLGSAPQLALTSSFVIAAWAKRITNASVGTIFIKGRGGISGYALRVNSDGSLRFTKLGVVDVNFTAAAAKIPVGVWCRIAVRINANASLDAFINGVLVDTNSNSNAILSSANNAYIGTDVDASGSLIASYLGYLAEVTVYPSLLTNSQISADYYSGVNLGVAGLWKFNEGSGATTIDSSGNGNNGTITSATYTSDVPMVARPVVNPNLVKNANFEFSPPFVAAQTSSNFIGGTAAGSSTNTLFGWYAVPGGVSSIRFDNVFTHSGGNAIKISATGSGTFTVGVTNFNAGTGAINSNPELLIPVVAGASYTLSGWAYKDAGTTAKLRMYSYKGSTFNSSFFGDVSTSTSGSWQYLTSTFNVPAGVSNILVFLEFSGSGSGQNAWFDDLDFRPTAATARSASGNRLSVRGFGTAFLGNGSNSYVSLPDGGACDISGGAAFSMSVWIKPAFRDGNGNFIFFSGDSGATTGASNQFSFDDTNRTLRHDFGFRQLTGSVKLNFNTWYLATITWDGTVRTLYLNNTQIGQDTPTSVNVDATKQAPLVGTKTAGAFPWKGPMDEFRFWSRGITNSEISSLYLNGAVPSSGLVCELLFNEGSGSTANDSSGSGNSGTLINGAYTTDVPMKARLAA